MQHSGQGFDWQDLKSYNQFMASDRQDLEGLLTRFWKCVWTCDGWYTEDGQSYTLQAENEIECWLAWKFIGPGPDTQCVFQDLKKGPI